MRLTRNVVGLALVFIVGLSVEVNGGIIGNLIVNGDFEQGNTGFLTEYDYSPVVNNTEGQYTVRNDPTGWHIFNSFAYIGDHTSGNGNMMVVNGSIIPNTILWQQTLNVDPNSNYQFSLFISKATASVPTVLDLYINSLPVGQSFVSQTDTGFWREMEREWNSGSASTATLTLISGVDGLNDFYLDDISFQASNQSGTVPEPTTLAVFGAIGLAGMATRRRRKQAA